MGMEPNRGVTCTDLWVVLADSIQPLFAICSVSSLPACQFKKTSGVSCHMQFMTNSYGTCNPEAFDMTYTSYSKMNV